MLTFDEVLCSAAEAVTEFEKRTNGLAFRPKGVLFSEMLFVVAAARRCAPSRVVESGRARGLSTDILARCFPGCRIISIDLADDPDEVRFVEELKRQWTNVELIRGDSKELLSRIVEPGDVVLIDGPKSFRALFLGLELLADRAPSLVFLHDFYQGQTERRLLEQLLPEAIFSDDSRFVNLYCGLDEPCWKAMRAKAFGLWQPFRYAGVPQPSYGPTFACIPGNPDRPYRQLAQIVLREGFEERAGFVAGRRKYRLHGRGACWKKTKA